MRSPRSFCISASPSSARFLPSKRSSPETTAPSGSSPIKASAVIVLPEPDSPTIPRLSPADAENDISRTTRRGPRGVGRSTARSTTSSSISAPRPQTRIERVAQSVAEQIESEHAERDREAGEDRQSRRHVHPGLRVGEHPAPGGERRLRAEPEVGERGFGENGDGELDRRLHDQRWRDVRKHMVKRDGERPAPRRARRQRELASEHAVGCRAGQFGEDRHVGDADREGRVDDAGAVGRRQQNSHQQGREGEGEIAQLHDRVLDEALGARGEEAERDAECEADAYRNHADEQGDASAGENLRGDVAPQRIRAEPMRRRGDLQLVRNVESRRRIRRPDQRQRRGEDQQRHQGHAEPQARVVARIPSFERQTHAPARSRGSIAADTRSTSRFTAMTNAANPMTQSSTTSTSRLAIDWTISRPRPGSTKTFSTTTAPATRLANCSPTMVRIGGSAFGNAWRQSAAFRERPFARAVRMKSSFNASTSAERVTRVRIAACTSPSARAGSTSAPRARAGLAQPGKPPAGASRQRTAKISTSTMPNQKFGTARPSWLAVITAASPGWPWRSAA